MAADVGHICGSSSSFDLNVIFRDDIGEILAKVDSKLSSDVVDEMTDAYDMSTLLDIRVKMFRFAKKKLLESVSAPGNKDIDPVFDNSIPHGCTDDAQRMTEEWDLIARKGKPRVAMDTIDLLSYVSGECPYFPYKVIKKNPKRGKNGKSGRRNRNGKKQTLIPFTSVSTAAPRPTKSADNESVTSDVPASDFDTCDNDSQTDMSDGDISEMSDSESHVAIPEPGVTSVRFDQADDVANIDNPPNSTNLIPVENIITHSLNPQGENTAEREPTHPDLHNPNGIPMNLHAVIASQPAGLERPEQPAKGNQSEHQLPIVHVPNDAGPHHQKPPDLPHSATRENHPTTRATVMATQTEWDLWGSPISAGRSFVTPSKQTQTCNCDYNVRLLLDWKREIEKRVEVNGEQERARSNYFFFFITLLHHSIYVVGQFTALYGSIIG